jgi:hypothetical protein
MDGNEYKVISVEEVSIKDNPELESVCQKIKS